MSSEHYPWNILQIDETDDKKSIKKAYASLIKKHKPDDNPETFQNIKDAYEYAQQLTEYKFQIDEYDETYSNLDTNTQEKKEPPYSLETDIDNESQELIKNIILKVDSTLKSDLVERENIYNWKFLEQIHAILDIDLKEELSKKVFYIVSEYNFTFYKKNKRTIISTRIIKYINTFFDWESKWQEYSYEFGTNGVQITLINLENDDNITSIRRIELDERFKALFADLILSYSIAGIWTFFRRVDYLDTLILAFYIFVLSRFIVELIFNRSLGKLTKHIYISDRYGNKCTMLKTFSRHIIINLTLFPIYILIYNIEVNITLLISVFGFLALLHIFTFLRNEEFLHDFLTRTVVIKKEGNFEF